MPQNLPSSHYESLLPACPPLHWLPCLQTDLPEADHNNQSNYRRLDYHHWHNTSLTTTSNHTTPPHSLRRLCPAWHVLLATSTRCFRLHSFVHHSTTLPGSCTSPLGCAHAWLTSQDSSVRWGEGSSYWHVISWPSWDWAHAWYGQEGSFHSKAGTEARATARKCVVFFTHRRQRTWVDSVTEVKKLRAFLSSYSV